MGRVDYARGIGIFLVVAGHALGGLRSAGILGDTPRLTFVIDWIYSFHMPLFFFLSGLFVTPAMRGTLTAFVNGKLRSVVYPYVVWSVLQTLVQSGLASATNRQVGVESLLAIAYRPIMQFWFLYALFLIFVIFGVLCRAGVRGPGIFAFAVALYVYPHVGPLGPWGVAYSVANNMLYFAAGVLVASVVHRWIGTWAPRHALTAAVVGFGLVTMAVAAGVQSTVVGKPLVAVVGIAATAWLAAAALAFKAYVSVGRKGAESATQETAAYRFELLQNYLDIISQKPVWGWGRNTWPKVPGQPSIDNHYLLLLLMHGYAATSLLLSLLVWVGARLFWHGMHEPPSNPPGSSFSFTLFGTLLSIYFAITTVFMGLNVQPLLFVIFGWSEGYLLFGTGYQPGQSTTAAAPPPPPFRFERVLT